jgi:hypothetical protein
MLNRPDYKKLVKLVQEAITEGKAHGLVAITMEHFSFDFRDRRDFEQSWPRVMQQLDLFDDGTGTKTYTVRGYSLMEWQRTVLGGKGRK